MAPPPRYGRGFEHRPPMYGYGAPQPGHGYSMNNPAQARSTAAERQAPQDQAGSSGAARTVDIANMRFNPGDLTVEAGQTVTWTLNDRMPHTVSAQDGSFSSPTLSRGDAFSHTFDQPGTFEYVCSIHPGMRGRVTVE